MNIPDHLPPALLQHWWRVHTIASILSGEACNWNGTEIRCGDHIMVWRGAYYHHGLYLGYGKVIHFQKKNWLDWNNPASVRVVSIEDFADKKGIAVVPYRESGCFSPYVTMDIAINLLGSKLGGYRPLANNCEHYATYCKTGEQKSGQVYDLLCSGIVAAGAFALRHGGVRVLGLSLGPVGTAATIVLPSVGTYFYRQYKKRK